MASPVGSLVVRIGADITELKRGVSQAQGHLAKIGASMRNGINIAGKYAAAMAAAGAALTAALVTKAMGAIDAQAKLARQLRTSNVSLETLTRAADLAGIEKDKMTAAVKRLDVAIGESIRGTKTYKDAFDALGLSASQISKMDADERIRVINQALIENVSAAQRAQVAGVLFGNRVGSAIASISVEELRTAREEVEALGLAVSEVDSSTIERASDALSSLKEVFRGAVNRLTVQLAPMIEGIAIALRNAAIESRGFEAQINDAFAGAMKAVGFFSDMVQGLRVTFKGVELVAVGFGAAVTSALEIAAFSVLAFVDGVNQNVNAVLGALNKLPKVDIPLLDSLRDSDFMQALHSFGDQARNKVGEVRSELHDLAMQEMPSDKVVRFLAEVTEASRAASEAANSARREIIGDADGEGGGEGGELERIKVGVKRLKDETAERLSVLRQRYGDEAALEQERFAKEMETLTASLALQRIGYEEHYALKEAMEREHQARMTEIELAGLTERQQFERASLKDKAATIAGELAGITSGVSQHNKKMFELNKAAGIANAIINAYEGISRTLKAYPYPINIGMAAAHGVAAFAQVKAIKSQSFSGGGTGTTPSLAGSSPVVNDAPAQRSPTVIHVKAASSGQLLTMDQVRALIGQINTAIGDGTKLVFN